MDTVNPNPSPGSPSDAASLAANFDVVFHPALGLLKTYAAPRPPFALTAPTTAVLLVMAADHPNASPVTPSEAVSSAVKDAVVFQPLAAFSNISAFSRSAACPRVRVRCRAP